MDRLNIDQLHQLRLRIFDNAEALYKEGRLLFENSHFARAYLLAHLCCEELGKIPIVVGVIGRLLSGESVDWKKVRRRFTDHKEKIDSDDYHHYVFGLELDLLRNSDIKWLSEAQGESPSRVRLKNRSTYVDVQAGTVFLPSDSITRDNANEMLERAFRSLRAHWHAESLTNPILVDLQRKPDPGAIR